MVLCAGANFSDFSSIFRKMAYKNQGNSVLVLPEGSVVLELPQNLLLSLPNDGGQFRRLAQVEGRHLQLTSQVLIRKSRFAPEEYKALREFYDRLVAAQAEAIVLKCETAASAAKKP